MILLVYHLKFAHSRRILFSGIFTYKAEIFKPPSGCKGDTDWTFPPKHGKTPAMCFSVSYNLHSFTEASLFPFPLSPLLCPASRVPFCYLNSRRVVLNLWVTIPLRLSDPVRGVTRDHQKAQIFAIIRVAKLQS